MLGDLVAARIEVQERGTDQRDAWIQIVGPQLSDIFRMWMMQRCKQPQVLLVVQPLQQPQDVTSHGQVTEKITEKDGSREGMGASGTSPNSPNASYNEFDRLVCVTADVEDGTGSVIERPLSDTKG